MPRVIARLRSARTRTEAGRDPRALLHLIWLASPALPVGGFSYSEGLEAAVDAALVSDEASTTQWLLDQLHLALGLSELAVASRAFDAWQAGDFTHIAELNDWVRTTRETSELRQQTEQMGRSMLAWLKNRGSVDDRLRALAALQPAPCWPVAWALAAAQTDASRREAMLSLAFGWAENMVQAALKAVPLGQAAGQRVLSALLQDIPATVDRALALGEHERQAHAPMLAILSARHEAQYSRLFRS